MSEAVEVFVAGWGFYERLTVRPLRLGEKPGRVVCQVIEDPDQEVVVDLSGDLDESEFWPSGEPSEEALRAWLEGRA
jgi:hypothetical protein